MYSQLFSLVENGRLSQSHFPLFIFFHCLKLMTVNFISTRTLNFYLKPPLLVISHIVGQLLDRFKLLLNVAINQNCRFYFMLYIISFATLLAQPISPPSASESRLKCNRRPWYEGLLGTIFLNKANKCNLIITTFIVLFIIKVSKKAVYNTLLIFWD